MNNDCIFCKIVAGELPSCKVYEDEDTLAFMDIGPVIKGHTLVVSKTHFELVMDTPLAVLQKVVAVAQKMARAQMIALKADGINIIHSSGKAAGQLVPHIHFHVIPRFSDDGHSWNWKHREYADRAEMQTFADKIRKGLS